MTTNLAANIVTRRRVPPVHDTDALWPDGEGSATLTSRVRAARARMWPDDTRTSVTKSSSKTPKLISDDRHQIIGPKCASQLPVDQVKSRQHRHVLFQSCCP